jgi:hypothetical protein
MGAYSMNFAGSDTFESVNIDSLLENESIEASFEESSYEAAMKAVCEATMNWNAIVEACAIQELNFLEESGTEMVYEGAALDSFIAKAKAFFMNLWQKIQGFFKKALMQFNAWSQSDKDFVKKYEKDLNKASNSGFGDKEIKWFHYSYYDNPDGQASEFADAAATFDATDLVSALKAISKVSNADLSIADAGKNPDGWAGVAKKLAETETKKEIFDTIRGKFLGKNEKVEAGDFVKQLKEKLQGGESKDSVKLGEALPKAIPFLKSSDKIKEHLNKELNICKKSIDNAVKCLDGIQKTLKSATEGNVSDEGKKAGAQHNVATHVIDILKTEKTILTTANGVEIGCLKAASRQAKAICVAAVSYKAPKSANEGGMLDFESDSSLLEQVRLV